MAAGRSPGAGPWPAVCRAATVPVGAYPGWLDRSSASSPGAVQTDGQTVWVVDVDHPAARCAPDLGVGFAECVEVGDPRLRSSPVGNREAHRIEPGVAG